MSHHLNYRALLMNLTCISNESVNSFLSRMHLSFRQVYLSFSFASFMINYLHNLFLIFLKAYFPKICIKESISLYSMV